MGLVRSCCCGTFPSRHPAAASGGWWVDAQGSAVQRDGDRHSACRLYRVGVGHEHGTAARDAVGDAGAAGTATHHHPGHPARAAVVLHHGRRAQPHAPPPHRAGSAPTHKGPAAVSARASHTAALVAVAVVGGVGAGFVEVDEAIGHLLASIEENRDLLQSEQRAEQQAEQARLDRCVCLRPRIQRQTPQAQPSGHMGH
jgi:hypothetical protein